MHLNLEAVRADLRRKTVYLADNGKHVLDNLMWYKTENFDRVVTKDAAETYDSAYRTYSQSQSQGSSSSTSVDAPPAPPAAALSAIVRLSNYKYFLTACSDWQPGVTDKILPLKDARPSAIAEDPGLSAIPEDYKAAWDALDELTRDIVLDDKGLAQSIGVINRSKSRYFGFKIGHKVFEVR